MALQSQVVFPACSRLLEQGRDPAQVFTRVHLVLALGSATVVTGAIAASPALTHVLYPRTYAGIDELMPWLAVSAWFQLLQGMVGAFLLAAGKLRAFILPPAVKTVATLVLVVPGWFLGQATSLGAFYGVILALIVADFASYVAVVIAARRCDLRMLRVDLALAAAVTVLAPAAYYLGGLAQVGEGRIASLVTFTTQGLLAVAAWSAIALVLYRGGWLVLRIPASDPQLRGTGS